jgi:hypothetical protein
MPQADSVKAFLVILAGGIAAAVVVHYAKQMLAQPLGQLLNSAAGVR